MIFLGAFLILAGLFLSAFYTALELAVISVNRVRLLHFIKKRRKGAVLLQTITANRELYMTISLIGINISNNLVVIVATVLARSLPFMENDLAKVAVFFTGGTLFFFWAELLPKALVRTSPTRFLIYTGRLITWSKVLFSPFIVLVKILFRILPEQKMVQNQLNRKELQSLFSTYEGRRLLSDAERDMAFKLFSFNSIPLQKVMTPKKQVVAVPPGADIGAVKKQAYRSGFTRIPVLDASGRSYAGIVNVFDVLYREDDTEPVENVMRAIPSVRLDEHAYRVLPKFQSAAHRMAFVLDKAGGCVGIVTVEDLIEEIMGEIYDEFD